MMRRMNKRRQSGVTYVAPDQAQVCRFYKKSDNTCRITIKGELICSHKRCTLFIKDDGGASK